MRLEKIEVPASVREKMEKPLAYLFARADRGGAGWIGRLDAPKGETFGGIMFYTERKGKVLHVIPLSETEGKMRMELYPICRWTCELPDGWEEGFAYMPPATAYCGRDMAYRVSPSAGDHPCCRVARLVREGMVVPSYSAYRRSVEDEKRDMLLRWRMGYDKPGWRLDWMVGAGMTPWDMARRKTTYPMEKDNPVGRRMMRRVAAFKRDYM